MGDSPPGHPKDISEAAIVRYASRHIHTLADPPKHQAIRMSATAAMQPTEGIEIPAKPLKTRKRFVGSSAKASSSKTPIRRVANQIPDDILHDPVLAEAIKGGCEFRMTSELP